MPKKICLIFLTLCLLLSGCAPAAQPEPDPVPEPDSAPEASAPAEVPAPEEPPEPELPERDRDWIEDIEFLRETIKENHIDPFYLRSEEDFDRDLDCLIAGVGDLSDNDIVFELTAIIASLRDTHLTINPEASHIYDACFPVNTCFFDDKLYLAAYHGDFEQFAPYMLHEIVAVNGVDIAYLVQKIDSLSYPGNSWYSREMFTGFHFYFVPAFFDWAGCDYKEGYTFQILNDNREVESVEVPVITQEEWRTGEWLYPENWSSLRYRRGGNQAGYIEGENGGCVYLATPDLEHPSSIEYIMNEAARLLEEHPDCGKLAIDLRRNTGGYTHTVWTLQEEIRQLDPEHTYILTGGRTMSMAMEAVACLKGSLDAITVGEPTGQFSSCFCFSGDKRVTEYQFTLPHSQLVVTVPDSWMNSKEDMSAMGIDFAFEEFYGEDGKLYEWENTILPDVYVYQDIEDIRQGKDTVMEWVLAQ